MALGDPRPVSLPFDFDHAAIPPKDLKSWAGSLVRRVVEKSDLAGRKDPARIFWKNLPAGSPLKTENTDRLAESLKNSQRPVIVCGTGITEDSTPDLAADLALLLSETGKRAGVFYCLSGPNAYGAALLTGARQAGSGPSGTLASGRSQGPDPGRSRSLSRAPKPGGNVRMAGPGRVPGDHRLSALGIPFRAGTFLPSTTVFEASAGSYINQEGRLQNTVPIHLGGLPVRQVSHGDHPPRQYGLGIPAGDPRPGYDVLSRLNLALTGETEATDQPDLWPWLTARHPRLAGGDKCAPDSEGLRIVPDPGDEDDFHSPAKAAKNEKEDSGFDLLLVDRFLGTEELSGYSAHTNVAPDADRLYMHPADAHEMGLSAGDRVGLALPGGVLSLEVTPAETMAEKCLVMARPAGADRKIANCRKISLPAAALTRE